MTPSEISLLDPEERRLWDVHNGCTIDGCSTKALLSKVARLTRELNTAADCVIALKERAEAAESRISDLTKGLEDAKKAIAWANNSLYGSHGYFLSLNGGEPNEHHLDSQIEVIKSRARAAEREKDSALQERDRYKERVGEGKGQWKGVERLADRLHASDYWQRELRQALEPLLEAAEDVRYMATEFKADFDIKAKLAEELATWR